MYNVESDNHMGGAITGMLSHGLLFCVPALMSVWHLVRLLEKGILEMSCTALVSLKMCKSWMHLFMHLNRR